MKKILLNILVILFYFVSVPESCVGSKNKLSGFLDDTTTMSVPPPKNKKEEVLDNLNNLLEPLKWEKRVRDNQKTENTKQNLTRNKSQKKPQRNPRTGKIMKNSPSYNKPRKAKWVVELQSTDVKKAGESKGSVKLTKGHINDILEHTKKHHHIVTREFELPKSENIYEGSIRLKLPKPENISDSNIKLKKCINLADLYLKIKREKMQKKLIKDLSTYRNLCKEINKLKKKDKKIENQIKHQLKEKGKEIQDDQIKLTKDNYGEPLNSDSLGVDSNTGSSSYTRPKRKHSMSSDNHSSKKRKTANAQEKLIKNRKEIDLKQDQVAIKLKDLKEQLPESFNLKTKKSKEAFINWAIYKKERPQDTNDSNRAVITAINAADKKSDKGAMLDILSSVESIKSASCYPDKVNNNNVCLELELGMSKKQHYFKQTKVGDSREIESGYSDKMVLILKRDKKPSPNDVIRASTMYIKDPESK